jgi:hypothetical protein
MPVDLRPLSKPLRPRSQQAWDYFRKRITELGGEVHEPEYLGALKPHLCRCKNGHECWVRPNDIQQGDGICRKCAAQVRVDPRSQLAWDAFCKRVAELGGVVLEPEWLGNKEPHRCRCAQGHDCRPIPNNAIRNGICRVCAGNDPATAWENFRKRVAELGGEVPEPEYLGAKTAHRCRCAQGHECRPVPGSVQQGQGICRACAGLDPDIAWENFRRRVTELGGVVLERRWLGALRHHCCLCVNGHECYPLPNNIQQDQGLCRKCADHENLVTAKRKNAACESFYARVAELGGVVLELKYLGSDKPHRCLCSRGHECRPRPHSLQQGQGMCMVCGWLGQDVLYVVRNEAASTVKFGITNQDGRLRLSNHRRDGFNKVIYLKTGLLEGLSAYVEQKIRVALEMAGAVPVRGYEYFHDENIALILNEIGIWIPAIR